MQNNRDIEVLHYLREKNNKVDSLKVIAARNVARYVENKADFEALEIPRTMRWYLARFVDDIEENTWKLRMACYCGDIEVVEDILSNEEVDINGVNYYGDDTPLICAVIGGHLAIVRRILYHPGIRLGKRDSIGNTALHLACDNNRVSIVKLLCQHSRCSPGVVNKKDRSGWTPLMIAVYRGHLDIVKGLDMKGTDFFTKDSDGRTLIKAARDSPNNTAEVLEYLIERNKVDSLQVIAAHNVARYVENEADIEALEILPTMRLYLTRFVDDEE